MSDIAMESGRNDASEVDFKSMGLRPGAQLQIQNLSRGGQKYNLRFVGEIRGRSILLTLPVVDGQAVRMTKGQSFVIRGFNGRHAYAFTASVVKARSSPFPYVHFSYPPFVEYKLVRKSLRVNVNLPASIVGGSGGVPVTLLDLSTQGSKIDAAQPIGQVSDAIIVEFEVGVDEFKARLQLPATIRNAGYSKDERSLQIGIEFTEISRNDMLILSNFILATSLDG